MIQFGLSFLPDCDKHEKTAVQYYEETFQLCRMADKAGFSTIKMTQHYINPYGGYCPNPLAFLMAVATQTQHVRLMTGGLIASFSHPIKLAAEIAMLDAISHGRADIGFVRGFSAYEFDALGIPFEESRVRFESTIQAVIKLWTQKNASENTPYFTYQNVTNYPDCTQTPHPPIWCAAVRSRETIAWLAENKFNLMLAYTMQELAWLKDQITLYKEIHPKGKILLLMPLLLHKDESKAAQLGKLYLEKYHTTWAQAASLSKVSENTKYPGYVDIANYIKQHNYDKMKKLGSIAFGTPQRVKEQILFILEHLKINQILWNIDIGAMPIHISKNTLDLFITDILPDFIKDD